MNNFNKVMLSGILLMFCLSFSFGQQDQNLTVTGATVNPAPMSFPGGTGTASFNFDATQGATLIPGEEITITVCSSNIMFDGAPTGVGAALFTWVQDAFAPNCWVGTRTTDLPPFSGGFIVFTYTVTAGSPQALPANGFNVNLSPHSRDPSSDLDDDTSVFTYTTSTLDAVDDTVVTDEDIAVVVDVFSNDASIPTTGTIVATDPGNGTVVITDPNGTPLDPSDDVVTYTPDPDYNGPDSFDYTICDNGTPQECDTATVTVTVNPILDLVDDTETTDEDTPVVVDVYTNDNDIPTDGTIVATDPPNGTVVITDPNGTPNDPSDDVVTYTPDAGYSGPDTFDYTVCDTAIPQNCDTATVTVTVDPIVDVVDDTETTDEDTPVVVDVYTNDSNIPTDGTIVATDPPNGTVVITDPNGTPNDPSDDVVTYTPDADYSGPDTFDYTVCDTAVPQNCDTATVTVTVEPIADLVDDVVTLDEDTPTVVDVYTNDNDIPTDGTIVATDPPNGTVVITDPNGTPNDPSDDVVTYTPDPDYNGPDSFDYTVCDTAMPQNCDTATVTVTVDPIVDVVDDTETTDEDTPVVVDVYTNDNDIPTDGTIVATDPPNGTVVITDPNGTPNDPSDDVVTYTPDAGYTGPDTFDYTVCDTAVPQNCDTATVTVTVDPTVDVVDDTETTDEDAPVVVDVYTNDSNIPTDGTIVATDPPNGTVVITDPNGTPNDPSDDIVTYTPDADFNGVDTFDYTVCDTDMPQNCDTATVTVTVEPIADLVDDFVTLDEDTPTVIDVYTNDNDIPTDGTIVATDPPNGTVVITDPNGTPNDPSDDVVTYTPDADFNGVDTFDYTVCDTAVPQNCDTATVTVTVDPIVDVVDDTETTDEDTPVVVDVYTNDNDIPTDGTIVATDPPNGTVVITDPNGTPNDPSDDVVTYTPDAGFNGVDTFNYTVCDTAMPQNCDTATVTITVEPIADLVDDVVTLDEDTPTVVDVYTNDNDIPTDGTIVATDPPNGTVVITDPNGTPNDPSDDVVTYTPDPDFNGVDTFDYTVCDTAVPQNCDTATVTVTVDPILDLEDDTVTVVEDTPTVVDVYTNDNDIPTDGTIVATDPPNGTVVITDPNGTPNDPSDDVITYTPDAGYNGPDTFDYTVCDTAVPQNCDTATVTITVTENDTDGDGDPDVTDPDPADPCNFTAGSTPDVTNTTWQAADCDGDGVTNIDEVDPDGDGTAGPNGTDINNPCSLNAADITLPQTGDWLTADCDGDGHANGTDPNADTPTATDDSGSTPSETIVTIDILGNDDYLDNLDTTNLGTTSITQVGGTAAGTVSFDASTGELDYTPTLAESGMTVTVIYEVCNDASGTAVCTQATVTIVVGDEPDTDGDGTPDSTDTNPTEPCIGGNVTGVDLNDTTTDWYSADCDGDGVINGTEVDPDGDGTAGPNGTDLENPCSLNVADITLAQAGDWLTEDCDGDGNPNGTDPNPDTPTANDDTITVPVNVPTSIDIFGNDDFLENDGNTITDTGTGTAGGTVVFNPVTGIMTYIPLESEDGTTVTVVYEVCQGTICDTATVTINVGNNTACGDDLDVYNVLTPNGDGQNDVFMIGNIECAEENTVKIFNRWGVLVYETVNYGSNGNYFRGISEGRVTIKEEKELPVGTYYYVIDYITPSRVNKSTAGYLYIQR